MPRSLAAARRAMAGWHPTADAPPPQKRQALYDHGLVPGGLDGSELARCSLGGRRVAVVGAGFAGAAAAWYLEAAGVPVTVFEAKDRVGGRVLSSRSLIPGKVVEAGAELIGLNHAMWFELAAHFGLPLVPLTTEDDYESRGLAVRLRLDDHDLSDDQKQQIERDLTPVFEGIGRDAFGIDPVRPWTSSSARAFDALSVSDGLTRHFGAVSSLARTFLEFVLENDNCAPVSRQSYLGLLALVSAGRVGDDPAGMNGYWDFTETHRCEGGNQQLADKLTARLADLRLSTPVDQLGMDAQGVGIDFSGPAGGSEAFDFAVLTAPPTSWPRISGRTTFDPRAFTMAQGPAIKYLAGFDRPFWEDSAVAPSALWTAVGSVWESTDGQPGAGGRGLSVYAGGPYVSPGPNCAARLASLYPGPRPKNSQYVNWPAVPWIKTGYAVPAPGQVTTVGRALAAPFANRLFFAGEQASMGFFGYMEGALQSGAAAARAIVAELCPAALGLHVA